MLPVGHLQLFEIETITNKLYGINFLNIFGDLIFPSSLFYLIAYIILLYGDFSIEI